LKQEIGDLKIALVETGVDVGPAIYLARVFNTEIDTVVKFFIFILVFVFDPLAVSLVIAASMAFELAADVPTPQPIQTKKSKKWWEVYGDKKEKPKTSNPSEEKIEKKKEVVLKGGIDLRKLKKED